MTQVADQLGAKVAGFTVLGLVLLGGLAWGGISLAAGDKAPRNARVEGVSIAGLTPAAAETRLRAQLEPRTGEPIEVSYGDGRTTEVDPHEAGLSIDYPASVREAGGGSGLGLSRIWQVVTGGGDHRAAVHVDQSGMQATLDQLSEGIGRRPREGTVSFRGGRAVPAYGQPGLVVSRNATQDLLVRRFLHGGSQKLPTQEQQPEITAAEVRRALHDFGRPAMSGPVTLVLAGEQVVAPPRLLAAGLSMQEVDGTLVPRVDGELLLEALQPVMRTIGREPEDARFAVRGERVAVVPAKVGVQVDPAEIEDRFAQVVVRRGAARRLVLHGRTTEPHLTTADARKLGITRRVSSFTTRFPYADYRNVNLSRAAQLIDGKVLRPGETFSVHDTVGEPTRARGFTEGFVVADGVFRKDLGGGVSEIATPIYNAMYLAGLKDVEHTPHSVYDDRYPEGREAMVSWPGRDLRFADTTPYGVLVKASVRKSTPGAQGAVTVSMYSTPHWRISSRTGPRTGVDRPIVRYVRGPGCRAIAGSPGFGVDVVRVFRGLASGKVLRTERRHTDYVASDTVRCGSRPQPSGPHAKPGPRH